MNVYRPQDSLEWAQRWPCEEVWKVRRRRGCASRPLGETGRRRARGSPFLSLRHLGTSLVMGAKNMYLAAAGIRLTNLEVHYGSHAAA